ncbi:F-box only protein 44-like isoform 1-T1 [Fundulus diaphanus]
MKRTEMGQTKSSNLAKKHRAVQPLLPTETQVSLPSLNSDILEEIFLNLPPNMVVCVCRLVCHEWKEVADRQSLWREKCRRVGYSLGEIYKSPDNWRMFYFLLKKKRNLIENPRGEEGLSRWIIRLNGGDGWTIEPIMEKHPDVTVRKNFVTSFYMCEKYQIIDLENEGYNSSIMDTFQPDIRISEWFASRFDCGCKYNIRVELLNERMEYIEVFAPRTVIVHARSFRHWNQMTHIFQNYGPGVRYIRYIHGGIDTRYWKGSYGVHLTDCCVEICPPMHSIVGTGFGRTAKDESRNVKSRACTIS